MIEVKTEGKIIKSWCEKPDDTALRQAINLARLPFIYKHVALMPDTHAGYGMPIGGVIACEGVVIPNAVGVDIGCGVLAVKTSLKDIDRSDLKNILGIIRKNVPVGFEHRKERQAIPKLPACAPVCEKEYENAERQLGTLGGGNHFIEIQKGSDNYIWYIIHSGSRNLGKKVADHYNRLAKELNSKARSSVPPEWDLAFLNEGTDGFDRYITEMTFCLGFAQANRDRMSEEVRAGIVAAAGEVIFAPAINIHHNYAAKETHFGRELWVHRKGATSARKGQMGIIPGSQGTKSYIVKGKGNTDSFMSCSHGAGRVMGRNEAVRSLDFTAEKKRLNDQGILHSLREKRDLEEAAGAYKNIDTVMLEQAGLVSILTELQPLAVIKG